MKSSDIEGLPRHRTVLLALSALLCAALICGVLGNVGRFSEHWSVRSQAREQNRVYYESTCINMTVKADIPLEARRLCDHAHVTMQQSPCWKATIDTLDSINVFKDGYALQLVQSIVWTLLLPIVAVSVGAYLLWDNLRARLTGSYAVSSCSSVLPSLSQQKHKLC